MPSGAGAVCRVPAILHPEGRKASAGKLQGTFPDMGLAVRCTEGVRLSGRTNPFSGGERGAAEASRDNYG
jgi:hypothetical protein